MNLTLDNKYQTILITGGAGFIGSHLCEKLLKQNKKVKCVDNLLNGSIENINEFMNNPNFKFIKKDICTILEDEKFLNEFKDVDLVLHNACAKCTMCLEDPKRDLEINAWGTFNVIKASVICGVKKIIHASTGSVYGEPQYFPEDEKHPCKPSSFYGNSKLAGENYYHVFAKMHKMDYTILRYFHVYGTKQQYSDYGGVIPIFIKNSYYNLPITIYGDGTQIRSFTSVDDIVNCNILCANSDNTNGEIYNCCSALKITINELVNHIKEITNTKSEIIYKDWKYGDIKYFDVNNDKIKKLGYDFNIDFRMQLEKIIDWYFLYFTNKK